MLPSIRLGGPAVFLASDADWALLAVSADGAMRLWDLRTLRLELESSVEPLLSGTPPGVRGTWPPYTLPHRTGLSAVCTLTLYPDTSLYKVKPFPGPVK